jgi:hypothetical protein
MRQSRIYSDDLRWLGEPWGEIESNSSTRGMADDRAGLPVLLRAKRCDILGHSLQPAARLSPKPGKALTGQIDRDNPVRGGEEGDQVAKALRAAARAVQEQQKWTLAGFLNMPFMWLAQHET